MVGEPAGIEALPLCWQERVTISAELSEISWKLKRDVRLTTFNTKGTTILKTLSSSVSHWRAVTGGTSLAVSA